MTLNRRKLIPIFGGFYPVSTKMLVHDKEFIPLISSQDIEKRVVEMGKQISDDYRDQSPVFLGILNGAFIFTSDLVRALTIPCEVSFIKLASYDGLTPTGEVKQLFGINEKLSQRSVIIVEDIVDTGDTLTDAMNLVQPHNPISVEVASLLLKPTMLKTPINIKYVGFEIPEQFVVGYGLDYNGFGRNLKGVYQLNE